MSGFSISVEKPGFRLAFKTFWTLNFDIFCVAFILWKSPEIELTQRTGEKKQL